MSEVERSTWAVADGIGAAFMRAAVLARTRMLDHASPIVRMRGQRNADSHDAALLERELEVPDPNAAGSRVISDRTPPLPSGPDP